MTPIRQTPPTAGKRVYPHVNEIADWQTAQTVRLLWDRVHDLTERVTALTSSLGLLITGQNSTEALLASVAQDARQGLARSQSLGGGTALGGAGGGAGGGGGVVLPGGGDGGGGSTGCAAAGATGHDTGGLLTAIRAGQIVCGTGNEHSALKNPTADLSTRDANATQLLRRMIWHLKQAGFTAGRQQNPSGAISKDKLTVIVDAVLRAYDVFSDYDNFATALKTQMSETAPAVLVDDAGIPD